MNPNPTCEKECRFTHSGGSTTMMYYPPVYDKHGNNVNPDGNITSGTTTCSVCNKKWNYSTQYGKTRYDEQH